MNDAERTRLHTVIRTEFAKHRFDTFIDEPPSIARGGRGVVVPGYSICRVRCQTVSQFTDHLAAKACEAVDRELFVTNWARLPVALHKLSPVKPSATRELLQPVKPCP